MKTRLGFVSNSSSASFVLHTNFTPDELGDLLREEGMGNLVEEIKENQLGRGCLCGWTSMWNDDEDMGETLIKVRDMLTRKFGARSYMITVDSEG
jgi:hypothetical protein